MKQKPRKRKSWRSLILAGSILLTACSPEPLASPITYCPAAIHPDAVTRAWLRTLKPPAPAVHYFNQIANQQRLFDRGCK